MRQEKFIEQSYSDALNDYIYSCMESKSEKWDWIVLTAANKRQAEAFELQIEKRRTEKRLPLGTKLAVIPDYEDMRIGSGGATLNVMRFIAEQEGYYEFLNQKILVIHSGGDSKRIPQYSACGKLFSTVPRILPGGNMSTVFDELLILAAGIPNRIGNGMMIFPSDTELLFNTLQLDLLSCDAAGLSIKASVLDGQEHGVFLQGKRSLDNKNKNVACFLHKLPEAALREKGAVDDMDHVDIDTGCIWMGRKVVEALSSLIYCEGRFHKELFKQFVNPEVCLNFYADFVYPLADEGSLEEFMEETPENGITEELISCRKIIWKKLHPYSLSLIKIVPARYIHFGMTHELFDLFVNHIEDYSYLGWNQRINTNAVQGTVLNSFVSQETKIDSKVLIENSIIDVGTEIREGAIISNVDIKNSTVPENVVLSGTKLKDGRFVCRIYGREDNPKASGNAPFLNGSIEKLINAAGITKQDIWDENLASIWHAAIFPAKKTIEAAVDASLVIYRIMNGTAEKEEIEEWVKAEKFSLCSSFYDTDVPELLRRQTYISRFVKLHIFYRDIRRGREMHSCIQELCRGCDKDEIKNIVSNVADEAEKSDFPNNMRLFLAVSDICKKYLVDEDSFLDHYEDKAYDIIKTCISKETYSRFPLNQNKIRKDVVEVELPVRVNFCGSPSDAAPYCLEHGGTMLDGALLLKGKKPVKAAIRRTSGGITFESIDQGKKQYYTDIRDIQDCGNPFDPFALHKAVLAATGLIPLDDQKLNMDDFCNAIGGGICLVTEADVPKGSGLGTSSIIAAAAVQAIHQFFGYFPNNEAVYAQVFLAEQLMNTGGGWQDQVGGLTEGIKYFTANPGIYQKIEVENLHLADSTRKELNRRFALIFSGQRRLARNVLREEMNQCIRNDKKSLAAVKEIQEYCAVMRHYLLKGNITEFAKYITKQFELVKILDKGASNTCIEYIFDSCEDLIDGKAICGAGGGGFLQVILKEGVTKQQLKDRISETFIDCGVEVWDCELI